MNHSHTSSHVLLCTPAHKCLHVDASLFFWTMNIHIKIVHLCKEITTSMKHDPQRTEKQWCLLVFADSDLQGEPLNVVFYLVLTHTSCPGNEPITRSTATCHMPACWKVSLSSNIISDLFEKETPLSTSVLEVIVRSLEVCASKIFLFFFFKSKTKVTQSQVDPSAYTADNRLLQRLTAVSWRYCCTLGSGGTCIDSTVGTMSESIPVKRY